MEKQDKTTLFPTILLDLEQQKYLDMVSTHRIKNLNENLPNVSTDHAGIIFSELVKSAQRKIRIFSHALNADVINYYANDLVEFIGRGGELDIICEENPEKNNPIYQIINYCEIAKNLKFAKDFIGDVNLKINKAAALLNIGELHYHFATFDEKAFRLETDIAKRKAIANFNDPKFTSLLISFFDNSIRLA